MPSYASYSSDVTVRPREWMRVVPTNVATAPASPDATSSTTASRESGRSLNRYAPPETGGISATSSPSASSCPRSTYVLFSAYSNPGGSSPSSSAPHTSPTRATPSTSRCDQPARSRRPANRRTVTRTRPSCRTPDSSTQDVPWNEMPRPRLFDYQEPPERPEDPAVRSANLRRIGRLFAAYKLRLAAVLALIVLSAALGVIPAFLLRGVLHAIERSDTTQLSYLAGGMIAIAVVTGVLGVIQTLLSNQVGQRVMHDLRAAVFRHLQRLSLAFFTRTRTGEVQSRVSNDIGGVQNVVTNTATSIAATMIGMLALNWKLALFAFALIPVFVLLTRRVGNERRRIAKTTQETMADISSLVQES